MVLHDYCRLFVVCQLRVHEQADGDTLVWRQEEELHNNSPAKAAL